MEYKGKYLRIKDTNLSKEHCVLQCVTPNLIGQIRYFPRNRIGELHLKKYLRETKCSLMSKADDYRVYCSLYSRLPNAGPAEHIKDVMKEMAQYYIEFLPDRLKTTLEDGPIPQESRYGIRLYNPKDI